MIESNTDGIGDDQVGAYLGPVIEWQPHGEHRGLAVRSLLEEARKDPFGRLVLPIHPDFLITIK